MRSRTLIDSFRCAARGLYHVLLTQRNMRVHFAVAIVILLLAVRLELARVELALLFFAIALVLVLEIVNTAVESLVDIVAPAYHPLAGIAKDVAAGAVLISAVNAAALGYILFGERLAAIFIRQVGRAGALPVTVFIAGGACVLMSILLAHLVVPGSPVAGAFPPSGHAALAAFLTILVGYISRNPHATALAGLISFIVIESRVETGSSNAWSLIAGLLLGSAVGFLVIHLAAW